MPYIHSIIDEFKTICDKVNEEFRFWDDGKDYDVPISNGESETVFTHDYDNNGDPLLSDTVYETVNQY